MKLKGEIDALKEELAKVITLLHYILISLLVMILEFDWSMRNNWEALLMLYIHSIICTPC